MEQFSNRKGVEALERLVEVIGENKQYLSDIDGAIGDGDHGINMNKGFSLLRDELQKGSPDLSTGLAQLSKILMMKIGGSMGPLYGVFFKAMALALNGKDYIGANDLRLMINEAVAAIEKISQAKQGDKTLMDTLIPAREAFNNSLDKNESLETALSRMKSAAEAGRDSTKNLQAKIGRSSRLGERSIGVLDAGAVSSCIIISCLADTFIKLLREAK